MNDLSIIVICERAKELVDGNPQFIFCDENNLMDTVNSISSKYVTFVKESDEIDENYVDILNDKVQEDFDCCYINCISKYDYKKEIKILTNVEELKKYKPYYGEYIWNFIFNREKFIEIVSQSDSDNFNEIVSSLFENTTAIGDVLYYHDPNSKQLLHNFCYNDYKPSEYYKNIVYFAEGCNGIFNGYISWVKNVGRCFADKFDITILYDEIPDETIELFSKYFNCVRRDYTRNYVADRFFAVYTEYYYPKNIFTLDENYMFIHGNMSDFENAIRFYDDIYTKYIAVSKVAAKKAVGYFPTDNIEYVYNPFMLDPELLKPHLRLVSAHRYTAVKGPQRIELMAEILDELEIPYTWNIFTDQHEGTNKNGLIYRSRVSNPFPYLQDSDYFVAFSDSEALGYSVLEALSVNTKVIVTPLEAYDELGIVDGENGVVIPFEYFDDENRDKLVDVIKKIYEDKEKTINYKFDETLYSGFNDLFIK